MKIAGIVAEYNPFHTGHAYQIAQTRAQLGADTGVVAVMSGNWVQQADCAIADKWLRARLALLGGVDLVLELPTVFAASSAESFAQGAVELLEASGVVTHLSFGSECGSAEPLRQLALCLDTPDFQTAMRPFLNQGLPFAVCRQKAAETLLGPELGALLSRPNNNLGVEYIKALNSLNSQIQPVTVQRMGAAHNSVVSVLSADSPAFEPEFVSATQIRLDLVEGNWKHAARYLVPGAQALLEHHIPDPPSLERVERAMLARLRTMTAEDWAALPDSGQAEGLPCRLEKAGRQCTSGSEFFDLAKTKRYTHARLRRLVLWAYLGLTAADRPAHPPYLRVLGFNQRGQEILKEMKRSAALPLITKPAHARALNPQGQALFALEARCTDLYDLCLPHIPAPGREWTQGPILPFQQ